MPKLIVFSSYFSQSQAQGLVEFRSPIKRGDMEEIKDRKIPTLIIDGYFSTRMAVSPMECISALKNGVILMGASSLGALRASELFPLGFKGIGRIYQFLKRGIISKDSDLLCAYSAQSGKELTLSMVHINYVLSKHVKDKKITESEAILLSSKAESIYWPERELDIVLDIFSKLVCAHSFDSLKSALVDEDLHPKILDGLHALEVSKRIAGIKS